jgi:hypothetical protein
MLELAWGKIAAWEASAFVFVAAGEADEQPSARLPPDLPLIGEAFEFAWELLNDVASGSMIPSVGALDRRLQIGTSVFVDWNAHRHRISAP